MKVPINTSWDFSFGLLSHNAIQIPAPLPVINFAIELPATMFWPPGYALNKLSMTSTVKHRQNDIVLDGHDHGPMQLHVTIPIVANPLLAVIIPMSSRKMTFSTSIVKMDKKNVACSAFVIPTPMMTCGDPVGAPTTFSIINLALDNVSVGITGGDIGSGLVDIVISMGIDVILHVLFPTSPATAKQIKDAATKKFKQVAREQLLKQLKGDLLPDAKSWTKKGLSALAGLATSTYKGDPTFQVNYGNDWLGGGVEVSKKKGFGAERHALGVQEGIGAKDSQVFGSTVAKPL